MKTPHFQQSHHPHSEAATNSLATQPTVNAILAVAAPIDPHHRHHVAHTSGGASVDLQQFSDEEEELLDKMNNNEQRRQEAEFINSFPPGHRFNPTDEELVQHYLKKKIMNDTLPPNKIMHAKLRRYNPEMLAKKFDSLGEKELYLFTPRDRKYPNGFRPNRAAGDGYWKATGADKQIKSKPDDKEAIGFKKALVFYKGKPPKGTKTNWIMHEYRVPDSCKASTPKRTQGDMRLDDWVLCRIYKKADSKNKTQIPKNEADHVGEDTEMEMNNSEGDNLIDEATKVEEDQSHLMIDVHQSMEFDDRAYRYDIDTSYLRGQQQQQPMICSYNNNMLHQQEYDDSLDSILYDHGSFSALQFLDHDNCEFPHDDITSGLESIVFKKEGEASNHEEYFGHGSTDQNLSSLITKPQSFQSWEASDQFL